MKIRVERKPIYADSRGTYKESVQKLEQLEQKGELLYFLMNGKRCYVRGTALVEGCTIHRSGKAAQWTFLGLE